MRDQPAERLGNVGAAAFELKTTFRGPRDVSWVAGQVGVVSGRGAMDRLRGGRLRPGRQKGEAECEREHDGTHGSALIGSHLWW